MTYLSNSGDMFDGCCGILNRTIAQSLKMGKKVQFKIHLCIGIYLGGCMIIDYPSSLVWAKKTLETKLQTVFCPSTIFFFQLFTNCLLSFFVYFRALCIQRVSEMQSLLRDMSTPLGSLTFTRFIFQSSIPTTIILEHHHHPLQQRSSSQAPHSL